MAIKGTYKNILVAVDGSDSSSIAFTEAVEIAKRSNATLHVTEIVDNLHSSMPKDTVASQKELAYEHIDEYIERSADLGLTTPIKAVVEVGSPKHLLTTTIPEAVAADLIVIGANGKHFLMNTSIGSVASYVVNNAPCSVLVSR
ncbi:universal stress protein [Enterococcus sp. LJL99]